MAKENTMLIWLRENAGTIIVCLMLGAAIFLIIRKMLKDKRAGRSACGGSCSECRMNTKCNKE